MDLTVLVGSIQRFSTEDGPGIRTTVFLKGCPLNCRWCHNPELIAFGNQLLLMPDRCIKCGSCVEVCPEKAITFGKEGIPEQTIYSNSDRTIRIDRTSCTLCMRCVDFCCAKSIRPAAVSMTAAEIMSEVLRDRSFYEHTGGGMTISGGELLSCPQMVSELLSIAEAENIGVCLDTSGFGDGNTLRSFAKRKCVSNVLYDMKSIDSSVHQKYTGVGNELILKNLRLLAADADTASKIIVRMPLIKDVNDTPEIIEATANFYKEIGIKHVSLLPYHNLGISKCRGLGREPEIFSAPSDERLEEIQKLFEKRCGIQAEISGKS